MGDEDYERIMEARKRAWQNKEGGFRAKPDEGGSDDENDSPPEPVPEHVAALKEKADAAYNEKQYQQAIDVRRIPPVLVLTVAAELELPVRSPTRRRCRRSRPPSADRNASC
eukprot:COSAG02_NODE_21166_length_799_cov_1.321429_2_plen_112_part_00